jgi:GH25 family lysozyme M1 (1,4-beta-N-acetylmuramidase)
MLQMLSRGRPLVVAAASAPIQGVDVSSSQHSGDGGINWGQVAGAGYQFALVKVTEGNYYVNPYFDSDYRGAKSAKLYAGAYHFAIPSASDGTSQADYFLDSAAYKADGATLPPALDIEWNPYDSSQPCYGLDGDSLVSWVAAFRAEVERRTGRLPAIYTAASWWNDCTGGNGSFAKDPLWIASYDTSSPSLPSGWPSWTLWQFTSSGNIPGINGDVDVSYFSGTQSDLAALAGNSPPAGRIPRGLT